MIEAEMLQRGPSLTTFVIRLRLFAGSYVPLWLILFLRWYDAGSVLRVVIAVLFVSGSIDMINLVYWKARRVGAHTRTVLSIQDRGGDVAGYVASYLLPFVASPSPSGRDLMSYGLFMIVVALIYARSEMTQINPTVYLMGRKVVHITAESDFDGYVIVKSNLHVGDSFHAVHLDAEVLVEVNP